MSAQLDPATRASLVSLGDARVDLIVRTDGKPGQYTQACASQGIEIRHLFNLLPGMAVSAPAAAILRLADEDWVTAVEFDREVRTM